MSFKQTALALSLIALCGLQCEVLAQQEKPPGFGGITMTIYPVARGADGIQYLITPSGKQVTVPGLGIAQNATQVSVYRDKADHFWYTDINGQQIAVTPQQLEAAQAQINAQSGGGGMPPQAMPQAQSYYNSNAAYAGGFNGIPYGTPINQEAPGQYSYMAPGGNKQFVTPTAQTSDQFNQWQQQVPYRQQPNVGAMQGSPQTQVAPQTQGAPQTAQRQGGQSGTGGLRERRAERLDSRAQSQASKASANQAQANSQMESGQVLGTGMAARRAAREERRSKREDRRADFLDGK